MASAVPPVALEAPPTKKPLRWAVLHTGLGRIGGAEKQLVRFLDEVRVHGADIDLFYNGAPSPEFERLGNRFPRGRSNGPASTIASYLRMLRALGSYDVVLVFHAVEPALLGLVAGLHGDKTVLYMDEPLRTLWEESVSGASDLPSVSQASATASQLYGGWAARLLGSPALSKLLVRLLRRWDRASVRRIPVRSALSRFIAEAMVRVYGIPLPSVVYHGLPNEYGSASLPTGVRAPAPIVLCVGAFIPYKDHRTLIEAWRRIERGGRFPSASLVLVGEGPLGPVLSARSAGLARVRFVGGASDAEVIDWYRRSALVVQPAIAEAFGMTPVEAAAFGVPAIVTRSGGIVEGVVDGLTGRTVAPRDPDEMARAIGSLLEDTDGRSAMGVRARSRQQSLFRIDRTARELLALGARGRPGRSRPR